MRLKRHHGKITTSEHQKCSLFSEGLHMHAYWIVILQCSDMILFPL